MEKLISHSTNESDRYMLHSRVIHQQELYQIFAVDLVGRNSFSSRQNMKIFFFFMLKKCLHIRVMRIKSNKTHKIEHYNFNETFM